MAGYGKAALLVVDTQRYYLERASPFYRYSESRWPGCMGYIGERVRSSVFPAVGRLRAAFDGLSWPVVYLRLCASRPDRSDLHRFFRSFEDAASRAGFAGAYPLASERLADVDPEIAPGPGDIVLDKSTFSGFSKPGLEERLRSLGVGAVVMTGLATSQCVDTTARDASERGFMVVHVEDGQADYDPERHAASLYASCGVCGGHVVDSATLASSLEDALRECEEEEARS